MAQANDSVVAEGSGWSIYNEGGGTRLRIDDHSLRSDAYDAGILPVPCHWDEDERKPSTRQSARMDRAACVQIEVACARICDPDNSDELDEVLLLSGGELAPLVDALRAEHEKLVSRLRASLLAGEPMLFRDISSAYSPGQRVVVGQPGAEHAAEIIFVSLERSMGGEYVHIRWKFLTHDGKSFREAFCDTYIQEFKGRRSPDEIGMRLTTPADESLFMERARRWKELVTKPSHVHCDGFVIRKSGWGGARKFRAFGRAMIDTRSLSRMDPNFSGFHGNLIETRGDDDGLRLAESMLPLAPPFVYGFSFTAKTWGEFRVDDLGPATYRTDAFDRLVMDASRKNLVEAITAQACDPSSRFDDFVDGKGGGAVFLLHGSPGVGKTLTAEAVSERLRRPLYVVGAGELGVTPDELESRLGDILEISSAWNAVLLIDECDVFLERRSASDVRRNAMVGIFLRLLEYHQGVLFLTTNRVGDIDEAFLSRVSLGLHYKQLSPSERSRVWSGIAAANNIPMSDSDSAALGLKEANGRQIKHAVRLAVALAKSESRQPHRRDLEAMIDIADEFKRDFARARESVDRKSGRLED